MAPPTCVVTGTLYHADGRPAFDVPVRLQVVDAGNNAVFIGSSGVTKSPLVVNTDENGVFQVAIARNVSAIITIEELDYHRQVIIPDQSSVNIKDL
jgi:hypothetical protein